MACLKMQAQNQQEEVTRASLEQIFTEVESIRYQKPDSAIVLLQQLQREALKLGDTLFAIDALLLTADIYGNQANYAKSYDGLWKALFLSDKVKNDALRSSIFRNLGRFYSFYKKRDESLKYLQTSLDIKKDLIKKGVVGKADLVYNYYNFSSTYRELEEPLMTKKYVDSCFMYYSKSSNQVDRAFLDFEMTYVLSQEGKYDEAIRLLEDIEPWFKQNKPSYLVLVYAYWGDVYRNMSKLKLSELYYKKALDISSKYNSHIDFTPLVFEKLAVLYVEAHDYKKAFENIVAAKNLDAKFFDSRSENNRPFLEIKDQYRLEKQRQEDFIQKQKIAQLEQADKILMLQRVILVGAIIFLVVVGFLYLEYLRAKHRAEKQLIKQNKELEIKKSEELLELKNKELATSALQLVEKDEFLKDIKNKLKSDGGYILEAELNKVIKSISVSNDTSWEEFKLRFTSINDHFYNQLTTNYPKLSQTDLKACALIKLNFSSKDMARLLNISVESVHTTRYRLRKKMGLTRSVNLEKFISEL
jgi:tetratricopeptide (TPR) repeat protein